MNAALSLAEMGMESILVSQMPSQRSQSNMAAGGINAALATMGEEDSPALHAEDTLKAGHYLANKEAVKNLTEAAPGIVRNLLAKGMSFTLKPNTNEIQLRAFGGQSRKRTAYADAMTGRQLVHTLSSQLRRYEAEGIVKRLSNHYFLKLHVEDGAVCGVYIYNRDIDEISFIETCGVIIACGGMNGLFGNTTGSVLNTGAVIASLLESGVKLANLEMTQYHPTTVRLHGKNLLISEAARGEGGRLYIEKDGEPFYFMEEKYPERGNLMPRDVISMEEYRWIKDGYQIYLDLRNLGESVYTDKLKAIADDCKQFLNLDITKEPIPVEPGIHFCMGGILIDVNHRASLKGIYAAGECTSLYHGANRLGGNSLLAAMYGGCVAANSAAADSRLEGGDGAARALDSEAAGAVDRDELKLRSSREMHYPTESKRLQAIMRKTLGIVRNGKELEEGIKALEALMDETVSSSDPEAFFDENYLWAAMCNLGLATLLSAELRKESRGAHLRSDYPEERMAYRKNTVVYMKNGELKAELGEVEDGTDN